MNQCCRLLLPARHARRIVLWLLGMVRLHMVQPCLLNFKPPVQQQVATCRLFFICFSRVSHTPQVNETPSDMQLPFSDCCLRAMFTFICLHCALLCCFGIILTR